MRDFAKVFLLILFSLLFYFGLFLIRTKIHPLLLAFLGIALAVVIIIGGIIYLRRREKRRKD